jgi:hypothetical protein
MTACLVCGRKITICASCAVSMSDWGLALDDDDDDWLDEPASPELLEAMRRIDELFKR